jgi:hypothetical protein
MKLAAGGKETASVAEKIFVRRVPCMPEEMDVHIPQAWRDVLSRAIHNMRLGGTRTLPL